MGKKIKFSLLKRLSITNSKELPHNIKFKLPDGKFVYKEWVGIGWIDVDENDKSVEVVDD